MQKRWKKKDTPEATVIDHLKSSINVSKAIATLLAIRGVETYDQAFEFFRPNMDHLHDPFLMKGMEEAVTFLHEIMADGKRVMVYGDYDVDGTTSVALVYTYLSSFYENIEFYIPDRYKEGYGISKIGIDYAAENDVALMIALDCGIKANDLVQYAKEKNIEMIICDHHLPGDEVPEAYAVLDPKQHDCPYPYKELSGCGIGFKLVQAYQLRYSASNIPLHDLLDFCAISIACDIVELTGENRTLASIGLKELNTKNRIGIEALLEAADHKKEITIHDLVFVIGPRINAAGRIEHAKKAVELLTSKDNKLAKFAGKAINETNSYRKEIDREITAEALKIIEEDPDLMKAKTTVLYKSEWHKGVIGIVASRLIETHYKPTILLTESDGSLTGSARSVKGFDIYKAIHECSDLLDKFGGHKYAAGLTMQKDKFELFQKKFESVVASTILPEMLIPEIEIDLELDFNEITSNFFNLLQQFAPFGPQNRNPVFMTKGLVDNGYSRTVGAENDHLKLNLKQRKTNLKFDGIAFNMGQWEAYVKSGQPIDIAYSLEENVWNDKRSIQLVIKDIKKSENLGD
ncbi:MAG: single-stranded-DNA-specific exonuclease RecJ [Flavobacteriales bacterium]|nr:single-stranded-DNA-specific exonuclease RecJ [Flavobacteriales bacterium]